MGEANRESRQLYIKVREKASVRERRIRLGQISEIWCLQPAEKNRWEHLVIRQVPADEKHRYVISAIEILEKIHAEDPGISVNLMGPTDVVVDCRKKPEKKSWFSWLKTLFVCLVTFVGAAFAIMTFNQEVDVGAIFQVLYLRMTGQASDGKTVLEWTYSLGIFLGIVVFYNHFTKLQVSDDPTPLEVQMRLYEQEVNTTIIENSGRQEDGVDVQ